MQDEEDLSREDLSRMVEDVRQKLKLKLEAGADASASSREDWEKLLGPINWPKVIENLAEEFESLRRQGPKWSQAQISLMSHIEKHLDAGDVVCRCYQP